MSDKAGRSTGGLGASGFVLRFIGALILVLVTYNPSGQSAYHWISEAIAQSAFGPLHLILVAILLIGWVVYWIASWRALGIEGSVRLEINTLVSSQSRARYREALVAYLSRFETELDEDSQRRLDSNPLRILDSKNPAMAEIVAAAPVITDHLDDESRAHFDALCTILDSAGISYSINPRLVRGLDYYSKTVFEWLTDQLGAQGAVCSGGRYDLLVEQLGGSATPAIGWALGVERLVALLRANGFPFADPIPDVYMVLAGGKAESAGLPLAEKLRDKIPGLRLEVNCGGGSFKSQFRRADRSGAGLAIIIGDAETEQRRAGLKPLRGGDKQVDVAWDELATHIGNFLDSNQPGARQGDRPD